MEDGKIKDSQITASAFTEEARASGRQARLNRNILPDGAWCVDNSKASQGVRSYEQSIKINFMSLTIITGIATQGRSQGTEYVKDYKISHCNDGYTWIFYEIKGRNSREKEVETISSHLIC